MRSTQLTELDAYLSVTRAIAGELDFATVLHRISEVVRKKLLLHDHMDVAVAVPDTSGFHVAFEAGLQTEWSTDATQTANENSPIRCVLDGSEPFLVTGDAWADSRFHFEGAAAGPIYDANLRSRIHVPLTVHTKILGALSFSRHARNAYSQQDVTLVQRIADLIAPYAFALSQGEQARISRLEAGTARNRAEGLRKGAQKLNDAMEAERRRIGMELHDQTLADLSTIYRYATQNAVESHHCGEKFAKISDDISTCVADLRGIIENARPGVLEMLGLHQAIEAHVERTVRAWERHISFEVNDLSDGVIDRCEHTIRIAVYRIVQEATTNAVAHSGCTKLYVILRKTDTKALVEIDNDGRAPIEGWEKSLGGVNNIRIRADLISASVKFEVPSDGGFRVTLELPVREL